MKWICDECNWTGDDEEVKEWCCPLCGGDITEVEREPDPLDEANSIYLHDQMNAIRSQL